MDMSIADGFIESGVCRVERMHLVLSRAGVTHNTSSASTALNIDDPD